MFELRNPTLMLALHMSRLVLPEALPEQNCHRRKLPREGQTPDSCQLERAVFCCLPGDCSPKQLVSRFPP